MAAMYCKSLIFCRFPHERTSLEFNFADFALVALRPFVSKMAATTTHAVDMKLEEVVVVYNPTETDSNKISTKMSAIIAEVTQAPSPATAASLGSRSSCNQSDEGVHFIAS